MSLPATIGRYEILGLLATGGMAEVLLAKLVGPAGFERAVVLKRVLPHLARQETFRTMFLDEARVVSALRHPNIAQVHELGEEDDELYLVMEYVEGETLSSLMRRLATRKERLPAHLAAHIIAESCAALHAAHELTDERDAPRNVVHRDVSPQNIMVTYDGGVKVLDFGIAKGAGRDTHTESGMMKGKFAYMSPEQCLDVDLDRRSDLFSLGTVLFEISTGRRLFARKSEIAIVRAVCDEPLPPPSQLVEDYPERLTQVVERSLARDRDERYATAAQMRRELVGVVRSLDPEGIPQEELATLMPKLFAERIEEKREMLRRVSSGSQLTHIPSAEASDPSAPPRRALAEAPTLAAAELESLEIPVEVSVPRRGASRGVVIAGALLATAAVGGAAWALAGGWGRGASERSHQPAVATAPVEGTQTAPVAGDASEEDEDVTPTDIGALPSEDEREAAAEPATIQLRVTTAPPGATVRIGEATLGETPLSTELDRATASVELTIERDGYEPLVERVVPDADQRLRLNLQRSRARRRGRRRADPAAQSSGGDDEQRPGYFRFE